MTERKWEIGDNAYKILRDIVTLATLIVSTWAAVKASSAQDEAKEARETTTRTGERVGLVAKEVQATRNDARKTMGLPPVPPAVAQPE